MEEEQTETENQVEEEFDFMGLNRFNPKKVNLLEPTF